MRAWALTGAGGRAWKAEGDARAGSRRRATHRLIEFAGQRDICVDFIIGSFCSSILVLIYNHRDRTCVYSEYIYVCATILNNIFPIVGPITCVYS